MEGIRKWEDLPTDLLVDIFGRTSLESRLLDLPFVCKKWYRATLIPLCWKKLDFPEMDEEDDYYCYGVESHFVSRLMEEYSVGGSFSATKLVKNVVNRGGGGLDVSWLRLPSGCTSDAFSYIADKCPNLKVLLLRRILPSFTSSEFPSFISKLKNLEVLKLGKSNQFQETLTEINIHCKNFNGLILGHDYIGEYEAKAIVSSLPNLKYLCFNQPHTDRDCMVTILKGCKELVFLDARRCIGFNEDDEEILKLASGIKTFKCEGSTDYDECCDDYDPPNYRDDGFHDGNITD